MANSSGRHKNSKCLYTYKQSLEIHEREKDSQLVRVRDFKSFLSTTEQIDEKVSV